MSEPTTEAAWGALYRALAESDRRDMWPDIRRILDEHRPAIEAEARASQPLTLDVERLATELEDIWPYEDDREYFVEKARVLRAALARGSDT